MNSKRLFLKTVAWAAPVISTISMPTHAQATPTACTFADRMVFDITALTTTDDWGATETPTATWESNLAANSIVIIELNGNDVTLTIEGSFGRTSAPTPFGAWGSTVTTGTINRDTGMINITNIGATGMHPSSTNTPRPHYYIPSGPFSLSLPCGATSATMAFEAQYLAATGPTPTSGFSNEYTLELRS